MVASLCKESTALKIVASRFFFLSADYISFLARKFTEYTKKNVTKYYCTARSWAARISQMYTCFWFMSKKTPVTRVFPEFLSFKNFSLTIFFFSADYVSIVVKYTKNNYVKLLYQVSAFKVFY